MGDAATIAEIRSQIAGGADPQGRIDEAFARARALEGELRAFVHLPDAAPVAGRGPLAGVTVGVKDLLDTADMPTAYGSPIYAGRRPAADAAVVARLRALGATVLGKTVTTEFAWRHPGPTRNPWNLAHTPGGSSSGSAAAVAAGIVTVAVGTQTLGSVIRPAAFCGVVGFKPSFGALPRDGAHPFSGSLDHVGLFARSVEDIADVFALLTDVEPTPSPPRPWRIAALAPSPDEVSAEQATAFERAWEALASQGWEVTEIEAQDLVERARRVADLLATYEGAQVFGELRRTQGDRMSRHLTNLVDAGEALSAAAHEDALKARAGLQDLFATLISGQDALLTVPATGEAPEGHASTGDAGFCAPWSALGAPAVCLPVSLSAKGLPLGVQLVGPLGGDAGLLATAGAAASALPRIGAPRLSI